MVLKHQLVDTLLTFYDKYAIFKPEATVTLMSSLAPSFNHGDQQPRQPSQMHLVRSESGRGVDRVVEGCVDMMQLLVPVVLSFDNYRREYLRHGVVHALRAT